MTFHASQEHLIQGLPFAILGIPFNNLSLSNITLTCLERIQKNRGEGKVSYLSTIDGTLITQCYGWLPATVDNPEMLSILRNADFSVISDNCLRRLAKLLGSTVSPPNTPNELLLSLCKALGEHEKGVFILGGIEKETKNIAVHLHEKFNKLRVVGIATPPIFTEGQDLSNSWERDALLVEQINSSNADVLLINLGGIKQRLWLERVRSRLSVPLVVTIDHALNEIKKITSTSSVPGGMKNTSLSRFYTKWKTISKKSAGFLLIGQLKLIWIAFSLVLYHTFSRYLYLWLCSANHLNNGLDSRLFLSARRSIAIIALPECLNETNFKLLTRCFEDAAGHDVLVIDFRKVRHIQPEGFYLLIKSWLQRNRLNKEIYGFCPSTDVQYLMKLHRTWDLFKNTLCDSAEILMSRLRGLENAEFYDTFTQGENLVTMSVLGKLNNAIDYQAYIKKLLPLIGQKNCCIDFSYCTYIDNSGFAFLLSLRKYLQSQQHEFTLKSVNKQLYNQFISASINKLFIFSV